MEETVWFFLVVDSSFNVSFSFVFSAHRIYQLRGHLRTSPKIAVKIEGALYHRANDSGQSHPVSTAPNILHPACVINGSFVSQTFQILYRNEDVPLADMAQFRLHVLVDSHKVWAGSNCPFSWYFLFILFLTFYFYCIEDRRDAGTPRFTSGHGAVVQWARFWHGKHRWISGACGQR